MITRPRRATTERAVVLGLVMGVLVGGLVVGMPAFVCLPAMPIQPTIDALAVLPIDLSRTGLLDNGVASVTTSTPTRAPTVIQTATSTVTRFGMPTAMLTTTLPPTVAPTPTMPPTATPTATLAPTATPELPTPLPPPPVQDAALQGEEAGAAAAATSDPLIAALAARINQARGEAGRVPLTWSPALAEAARVQAEDMATHAFVGHTGSDGSNVVERMRRVGYAPAFRGEIIAWVPGGPDLAFDWWWHSDLHHDTMLGPAYRDFGIARVSHPTRTGHNYFVVVFGRR